MELLDVLFFLARDAMGPSNDRHSRLLFMCLRATHLGSFGVGGDGDRLLDDIRKQDGGCDPQDAVLLRFDLHVEVGRVGCVGDFVSDRVGVFEMVHIIGEWIGSLRDS